MKLNRVRYVCCITLVVIVLSCDQVKKGGESLPPPGHYGDCCGEQYSVAITDSLAEPQYMQLALFKNNSLAKLGSPRYFPAGIVHAESLFVMVDNSDDLDVGSYYLRVLKYENSQDIGNIEKRESAAEAGIVQLSTTSSSACDSCVIELVYRTFIWCPIIKTPTGLNWAIYPYYSGDGHGYGLNLMIYGSRSYQKCHLKLTSDGWKMSNYQFFGSSQGWESSQIASYANDTCKYINSVTTDYASCNKFAINGEDGNYLAISKQEFGDSVLLTTSLQGFNPCADVLTEPAIDGNFKIWFRIDPQTGDKYYRVSQGTWDGYPWHEMYINHDTVFMHNPFETEEGLSSLFGIGDHNMLDDPIFDSTVWILISH